jgi:predicted PurR-regulated permease PerM
MNIQADPVGYKALSKHFAAARSADELVAEEVRGQTDYLKLIAYSVALLAGAALVAMLHLGKGIIMPVALGFTVGLIFGPLGDRGAKFGIPAPATILASVLGAAAVMATLLYMMLPNLAQLNEAIPQIQRALARIAASGEQLSSMFANVTNGAASNTAATADAKISAVEIATKAMAVITPSLAEFVIFLFTLLLFAGYRQDVRSFLVKRFATREGRLAAMKSFTEAEGRLTDYMFTVAAINAGLGVTVGTAFWFAGVPGAFVWGMLAFFLNFLPVVGPLLLKGLLLGFGLVLYPTILSGLVPIALFMVISLIEANAVTPKIVGSRLTMNPLLVFLSVIVWTWLWGFAGAFLAMPFLAIASVIRDQYRKGRSISLPQ